MGNIISDTTESNIQQHPKAIVINNYAEEYAKYYSEVEHLMDSIVNDDRCCEYRLYMTTYHPDMPNWISILKNEPSLNDVEQIKKFVIIVTAFCMSK